MSQYTRADLRGRVGVVTGGGSGLGAALAARLAGAGMHVAVLDIDAERAAARAAELSGPGIETLACAVDVGDRDSLARAAEQVAARLGACDVLCANVGVQQFGAIERLTEEDWRWVLDVNVLGVVRSVSCFLPLMRRRQGFRRIVLTASSAALRPGVRLGAYNASKLALVGFGETLRLELADEGIGVSILFPDGMSTRHLESSVLARPAELGPSVTLPDDIEAMLAGSGAGDDVPVVVTPEHATRNLIDELLADEPYIVTHGGYVEQVRSRHARIERAFDRMERS